LKLCKIVFLLPIVLGMQTKGQQRFSFTTNQKLTKPKIFAEGIISTGDYDTHPAFSPSGDTLYFLKCTADIKSCTICVSYFKRHRWTSPAIVPFSGRYVDGDPFVNKEGNTLYFVSNRPIHPGDPVKHDFDIWKVVMTGHGWSEPLHLNAPVNSDEDEYYPTLADNGNLYFSSARKGGFGACDIYRCVWENGKFLPAENLGEAINTIDNEYEPFISPDESFLIFMATRPQGIRNADFFLSYHTTKGWTSAEKLSPPINSDAVEFSPKITRDGKYFFFSSTRGRVPDSLPSKVSMNELEKKLYSPGNGLADIYQIDASELHINHSPTNATAMFDSTKPPGDLEELSALNARFIHNFITSDTASHNQIIHKDFVYISSAGKIVNRDEYMKAWSHGYDDKVDKSFEYKDEVIRIFGTMALVRANTFHSRMEEGKLVYRKTVYTDTYIKQKGRWWCIQAQITGAN
jgi:hypothetical protein